MSVYKSEGFEVQAGPGPAKRSEGSFDYLARPHNFALFSFFNISYYSLVWSSKVMHVLSVLLSYFVVRCFTSREYFSQQKPILSRTKR